MEGGLKKEKHNRLVHSEEGLVLIIKQVGGSAPAGKGNK